MAAGRRARRRERGTIPPQTTNFRRYFERNKWGLGIQAAPEGGSARAQRGGLRRAPRRRSFSRSPRARATIRRLRVMSPRALGRRKGWPELGSTSRGVQQGNGRHAPRLLLPPPVEARLARSDIDGGSAPDLGACGRRQKFSLWRRKRRALGWPSAATAIADKPTTMLPAGVRTGRATTQPGTTSAAAAGSSRLPGRPERSLLLPDEGADAPLSSRSLPCRSSAAPGSTTPAASRLCGRLPGADSSWPPTCAGSPD